MKTTEELNALEEGGEAVNKKLAELSEEELAQVSGGKASPKKSGSAITTEDRYTALAGLTITSLQ